MNKENKDVDITPEEMEKIHEALKDEKFRELFFDYCKEIQDPENRAKYEEEISQLERERGYDVTFVKPEGGHVIKVIDENQNKKVFINVCTSTNVDKAATDGGDKKKGPHLGENWTIPHIINKPRQDVDKSGKTCIVCDVVFHPDIYKKAELQPKMMKMLNDIALDSVQDKFGMKMDQNNVKYPKLKFKGKPESSVIRNKTVEGPVESPKSAFVKYPEPENDSFDANKELKVKQSSKISKTTTNGAAADESVKEQTDRTKPRYKIVHRGHFDLQNFTLARESVASTRPAELCVEIEMPMASSAAGVELDVFKKRIVLDSKKPSYYLDLALPYPVDEDKGTAKFDKSRKVLIVTLPVLAPTCEPQRVFPDLKSDAECLNGQEFEGDSKNSIHDDENKDSEQIFNQDSVKSTHSLSEKDNVVDRKKAEVKMRNNIGDEDFKSIRKEDFKSTSKEDFTLTSKDNLNCSEATQKSINSISVEKNEGKCTLGNTCSLTDSSKITVDGNSDKNLATISCLERDLTPPGKELCEKLAFCSQDTNALTGNSDSVKTINKKSPSAGVSNGNSKQKPNNFETNNNSYPIPTRNSFPKPLSSALSENLMDNESQIISNCSESSDQIISGKKTTKSEHAEALSQQAELMESKQKSDSKNLIAGESSDAHSEKLNGITSTLGPFSLEFSSIPDIAGMYKTPPYSYDQDEETITVNINISNVTMENVSLGFSNRKVYFSTVTEVDEDSNSIRWCLVMKFLEYCHLDSDLCSIDVEENRVVLLLQKAEDSFGLWNKFYAGSSEKDLEELFFLTDHSMSELFERIRVKDDPWVKKEEDTTEKTEEENEFMTRQLEANLEQLLKGQNVIINTEPYVNEDDESIYTDQDHGCHMHETGSNGSNTKHAEECLVESESQKSETDSDDTDRVSSSSDVITHISMAELLDDVICETESAQVRISRHPVERSLSDEAPLLGLRSILRHSPSGSTSEESDATYNEGSSARKRSQSFNFDTRPVSREKFSISRPRNKSVSFDLEPKVCEFVEYSKKQLKKMRKQERKQTEMAAKKSEALAKNGKNSHKNKQGKNNNKSKRNRHFFDSLRKDNSFKTSEDHLEPPFDDLDSKGGGKDKLEDNERPECRQKTKKNEKQEMKEKLETKEKPENHKKQESKEKHETKEKLESTEKLEIEVNKEQQNKDKSEMKEVLEIENRSNQSNTNSVKTGKTKKSAKKVKTVASKAENSISEKSSIPGVNFVNSLIYELDS